MLHYCYSSQHTHCPDRNITFYQNSNPWLDNVDIYIPNKLATQTAFVGGMTFRAMNSIPNFMPHNGTAQYLLYSVTRKHKTDSGYCELSTI